MKQPRPASSPCAPVLLQPFSRDVYILALISNPSHACPSWQVHIYGECAHLATIDGVSCIVRKHAGLHNLTYKKAQHIAKELGDSIRKLVVIVGELATSLEKVSDVPPTDWMGIGDTIVAKTEKVNLAEIAPFWTYIPKMKDFLSIKLLGAGGFG